MTRKGKRIVCFNPKCKGKDSNHFIHSCLRANKKERKEIITAMHKKWADDKQAKKVVLEKMQMRVTEDKIECQVYHQNN